MGQVNGKMTLLVTGAAGFIGRHVVAAARHRGHAVRAVVRNTASSPDEWRNDPMIASIAADLADDFAIGPLTAALRDADAVIHAAAAMTGSASRHARDTEGSLRTVISAMTGRTERPPRLVLVSSIAVYDALAAPAFSTIDETAPVEAHPQSRDAYCLSKLRQEALAVQAADLHGLEVRIMRPGAVFGPGRIWNGHLGPSLGPAVFTLETRGETPVSFVSHCAEALVMAAEASVATDDRGLSAPKGRVEVINVIDDDRPTRAQYLAAVRTSGWPRLAIPGLGAPLRLAGSMLGVARLSDRMPGLLRPAIFAARCKPFAYSNARLRERLGWRPTRSFHEAMSWSIAQPATQSAAQNDRQT
ncbi:MAG: NAD-dependent epimerase/dehydratase family protein [Hyphomicrobium sp.]